MTRKLITIGLLAAGAIAAAALIIGSFVSYAKPISAVDMQNIYISRILAHGIPILFLQIAAAAIVLSGSKTKNAP